MADGQARNLVRAYLDARREYAAARNAQVQAQEAAQVAKERVRAARDGLTPLVEDALDFPYRRLFLIDGMAVELSVTRKGASVEVSVERPIDLGSTKE